MIKGADGEAKKQDIVCSVRLKKNSVSASEPPADPSAEFEKGSGDSVSAKLPHQNWFIELELYDSSAPLGKSSFYVTVDVFV